MGTREIGFTGGEPFMNRDMIAMMQSALRRGFDVLVLTKAMRPMRRFEAELVEMARASRDRLPRRVSLDHYTRGHHKTASGTGTWDKASAGMNWQERTRVAHGKRVSVRDDRGGGQN